jgi:hypothetical protein
MVLLQGGLCSTSEVKKYWKGSETIPLWEYFPDANRGGKRSAPERFWQDQIICLWQTQRG